jgi:putative superfamily III holin-X
MDRMQTTPTSSEPSMTSLLSGIVNDAQELIKQQLQLFKHELRDDMKRAQAALPSLGVGVTVALTAVFFLGLTIAHLLNWAFGEAHLPLWVCYAIVTVVFGVAGCALLYFAKKNLESLPMSHEAAEATKENVEWLTKPK